MTDRGGFPIVGLLIKRGGTRVMFNILYEYRRNGGLGGVTSNRGKI